MNIIAPGHPDWPALLDYVDKQLNPRFDADGNMVSWEASPDFRHARAGCESLGLTPGEVDASEAAWRATGVAHCDVELLLNLDDDDEPDDDAADLEPVAPGATLSR